VRPAPRGALPAQRLRQARAADRQQLLQREEFPHDQRRSRRLNRAGGTGKPDSHSQEGAPSGFSRIQIAWCAGYQAHIPRVLTGPFLRVTFHPGHPLSAQDPKSGTAQTCGP
jgi:hypothetical protein